MSIHDLDALDRERFISLVTFRRTGVGVPTPVWFAVHDGRLWIFSEARAGKVKRLRNDARAHVVADADSVREAYAALHAKYGWQMRVTDFFSRLTGRIHARAILAVEPVA